MLTPSANSFCFCGLIFLSAAVFLMWARVLLSYHDICNDGKHCDEDDNDADADVYGGGGGGFGGLFCAR